MPPPVRRERPVIIARNAGTAATGISATLRQKRAPPASVATSATTRVEPSGSRGARA